MGSTNGEYRNHHGQRKKSIYKEEMIRQMSSASSQCMGRQISSSSIPMMPPISYAENALLQASGVGHPVVGSSAGTSKLNIYLAQPQSSLGQEGKNMLQPCQTS